MDIQNAPRKLLHEPGREQAHISSQANEVDLVLLQGVYNFAIVFFALFALGRNNHAVQTHSAWPISIPPASGLLEMTTAMRAPGIFPEATLLRDGFEVGAASGEEDAKVFHEELSAVSIQQSAFRTNHHNLLIILTLQSPIPIVILSVARDLCIPRPECESRPAREPVRNHRHLPAESVSRTAAGTAGWWLGLKINREKPVIRRDFGPEGSCAHNTQAGPDCVSLRAGCFASSA